MPGQGQTLSLSQSQHLQMVLAPQLRQSLEMLQVPMLELRQLIQKEMEQNPTFDYSLLQPERSTLVPGALPEKVRLLIRTLPKVQWPKPNIHAAIELKVKGEEDKLSQGLAALHQADPTFQYVVDGELRQTVLSAQGDRKSVV